MKYAIYNQAGNLELRDDSSAELPVGAKLYTEEFKAQVCVIPALSDTEIRTLFDALP